MSSQKIIKGIWNENCNSSAMYLLALLQRTRSVRRPPYEDSDRKIFMKTSFQRFFCLNLRMAELLLKIIFLTRTLCTDIL